MKTIELALKLYQHYREVYPQVKHYYGCVANYGLVELAELFGEGSPADALCREVLATFPDKVDHPHYNFASYRVGGIAKARGVYDGRSNEEDQLREYAEELMTCPRNKNGIISHPREGCSEKTWIDIATAATPFLLFAGLYFKEEKYIDEAVKQTLDMYELYLDPDNGLLHQAYGFVAPGVMSTDHWSRGNGWGIFPLAVLCEFLPKEHPAYEKCCDTLRAHCTALLPFRSENGMWRQEITLVELDGLDSYEETSGTGLILSAVAVGLRLGILDEAIFRPVLEEGVRGLCKVSVCDDFGTVHSCPGCLCPGDGTPRAYLSHKPSTKDEPHGAGPVIIALAEAYRAGLTELD